MPASLPSPSLPPPAPPSIRTPWVYVIPSHICFQAPTVLVGARSRWLPCPVGVFPPSLTIPLLLDKILSRLFLNVPLLKYWNWPIAENAKHHCPLLLAAKAQWTPEVTHKHSFYRYMCVPVLGRRASRVLYLPTQLAVRNKMQSSSHG